MAADRLPPGGLEEKLRKIRLLSLDVDGVLTDGGLYYADDGSQLRKFNVKDGMGMKRARMAGVEIAIISASETPSIRHRGTVLGIDHVYVGVEDKMAALSQVCALMGIDFEEVAHIGDDLNDIPVLETVGLPLTVADAVPEVLELAAFVTSKRGGEGAVREICDRIVAAREN